MEFYINDGEKSCNLVVMIVGKEMGEWSGVSIMGNLNWGALVLAARRRSDLVSQWEM